MKNEPWMTLLGLVHPKSFSFFSPYSSGLFHPPRQGSGTPFLPCTLIPGND